MNADFRYFHSFLNLILGNEKLKPPDLIRTAEALADARANKPLQSDLRRAVSTAYYALFHCLAKCCADLLVGSVQAKRSDEAWRQTYRALAHGETKKACLQQSVIKKFPKQIQDFANQFVTMQIKRHKADYDPDGSYFKSEVQNDIAVAKATMEKFAKAPLKDRRAFAVWVLLKDRKE